MVLKLLGDITKRMLSGNKEQLVTVFCCVDENLNVYEDFVRLHEIDVANGDFITNVIKNAVI